MMVEEMKHWTVVRWSCVCLWVMQLVRGSLVTHPHQMHLRIEALFDWKLCNNGETPNFFHNHTDRRCYHRQIRRFEDCDSRSYNSSSCRQASLDLLHSHRDFPHKIRHMFEITDHDLSIRKLTLTYPTEIFGAVSHFVDGLLTVRPWWYVTQETFPWHLEDSISMTMERTEENRETFLRWVTDLQYPDESVCQETPAWLGSQLGNHPGFSSALSFYHKFYRTAKYIRTLLYVSVSNSPKDDAQFASGLGCPNTLNKWECSFFPTTNCSVPKAILRCNTSNCVQNAQMNLLSTNARNGTVLKRDTPEFNEVVKRYSDSSFSSHNEALWKLWKLRKLRYKYMIPPAHNETWLIEYKDVEIDHYIMNMFFTRPNVFFRSLVDIGINDMEKKFNVKLSEFGQTQSCVAAHIRRGDRNPAVENVTQHCIDRPGDFEKGCGSKAVFGMVNLHHIIKHAERMVGPSVRTLFVATDDVAFLKDEMELLQREKSKWKIAFVPWIGPEQLDRAKGMSAAEKEMLYLQFRYRGGALSGSQFFATIKAMQTCEAFVGHFGSAVSNMIYLYMCERHSSYEGICPPMYNLGNGL